MKNEFAIISTGKQQHLCYKDENEYIDVSMPLLTFVEGEDEFQIVPSDESCRHKTYQYQGIETRLCPRIYTNGWLAITLVDIQNKDNYFVLTVNLESMPAFGLPSRTFVDCNNQPQALDFLVSNGLAQDTGYKRRNGFVEYPIVDVNLPLIYQHDPKAFQDINI